MKITISDDSRGIADAHVTELELRQIVDLLNSWGSKVTYQSDFQDEYDDEHGSVLDDESWFDDPDMGDR